jgi:hypothetical protein
VRPLGDRTYLRDSGHADRSTPPVVFSRQGSNDGRRDGPKYLRDVGHQCAGLLAQWVTPSQQPSTNRTEIPLQQIVAGAATPVNIRLLDWREFEAIVSAARALWIRRNVQGPELDQMKIADGEGGTHTPLPVCRPRFGAGTLEGTGSEAAQSDPGARLVCNSASRMALGSISPTVRPGLGDPGVSVRSCRLARTERPKCPVGIFQCVARSRA